MNVKKLFLCALKAALLNEHVNWDFELSKDQWGELFDLAQIHHVLPMVFQACYGSGFEKALDGQYLNRLKSHCLHSVAIQAVKSQDFLKMIKFLNKKGIRVCVVKGIICRNLYPNPDYRMSSDEDILVEDNQFLLCHEALKEYGLQLIQDEADILKTQELSYKKNDSFTYIELHKRLFPESSRVYGQMNRFFENVSENLLVEPIEGVSVYTLKPSDHLFYLICHAFKHFLHSGFGIRQVCDICMYANAFEDQIDWDGLYENCKEIYADLFAAALFKIAEKYLILHADTKSFKEVVVDEDPILEDILNSGVFGDSSLSRKHSSTATLNAVEDSRNGRQTNKNWLRSVFPVKEDMVGKYPSLKTKPMLLPVAWLDRILKYVKELNAKDSNVFESMDISKRRIELMKQYKIIKR